MPSRSSPSNEQPGAKRRPADGRQTTLVVVEFSATWPRWLKPKHFADATVIAQDYGENPIALMTEVSRRVAQLEALACPLGTIVVVSNGDVEVSARAGRHSLVRGLLSRLGTLGGGELLLAINAAAGRRARRELDGLVRSFDQHARRQGVTLSVRVGETAQDLADALPSTPLARAG